MKLIQVTDDMIMIGESENNGTWYKIADHVKAFVPKIPIGSVVEIKSVNENGQEVLNFIKVAGTSPKKKAWNPGGSKYPQKKAFNPYDKSPDVQESILHQAVGHMTSRALIALQGQVDINSIHEIASKLYDTFLGKVKERK